MVADDAGNLREARLKLVDELPIVAVRRDDNRTVVSVPHFVLLDVSRLPGIVVVHLNPRCRQWSRAWNGTNVCQPGNDVNVVVRLHLRTQCGDHERSRSVQVHAKFDDDD